MTYYTYPVTGLGYMPDPDSVQDHDTVEDAYAAFVDDVRVTCEHNDTDTPADLPSLADVRDAMPGGLAYGHAGWLHVIGLD